MPDQTPPINVTADNVSRLRAALEAMKTNEDYLTSRARRYGPIAIELAGAAHKVATVYDIWRLRSELGAAIEEYEAKAIDTIGLSFSPYIARGTDCHFICTEGLGQMEEFIELRSAMRGCDLACMLCAPWHVPVPTGEDADNLMSRWKVARVVAEKHGMRFQTMIKIVVSLSEEVREDLARRDRIQKQKPKRETRLVRIYD